MGFEEAISMIAKKIEEFSATLETEEATKTAVILPFIAQVLGYDVFDPSEVIPEFTADVGTKKGEKIDYAIQRDGQVQMLIECKKIGTPLDINHASQLFRYFHVSNARIGVLTNGQLWYFFTDLDRPNRMDERPFLQLDLADVDPHALPELKKLTKPAFDLDSVLSAAEELKYVSSLKREIGRLFREPSEDFERVLEAYSQTAWRPVKPLVRAHLRKAVNKPPYLARLRTLRDRQGERVLSTPHREGLRSVAWGSGQ